MTLHSVLQQQHHFDKIDFFHLKSGISNDIFWLSNEQTNSTMINLEGIKARDGSSLQILSSSRARAWGLRLEPEAWSTL